MAQRRSMFDDAFPMPASPMTPKGGSQTTYDDPRNQFAESKETFRRRTTPITGQPEPRRTAMQDILDILRTQ